MSWFKIKDDNQIKVKCPKCGRWFTSERGLKIHLASHERRDFLKEISENVPRYVHLTIKMDRETFEKWREILRKEGLENEGVETLIEILIDLFLRQGHDIRSFNQIIQTERDYFT